MERPFDVIAVLMVFIGTYIIIKGRKRYINEAKEKLANESLLNRSTARLRNKYIELHGDTRMTSAEVLDRQIEVLKKKYPKKSLDWCIEKAIHDLKRDRHIIK